MKCNGEGEMQTVYVKRLSHEDISSQTAAVFGLVAAVYSKDVSKALFRPAILPRLPRSSIPISISALEISHQTVWQVAREISPAVFDDCIHGRCIVKNGDTRLQARLSVVTVMELTLLCRDDSSKVSPNGFSCGFVQTTGADKIKAFLRCYLKWRSPATGMSGIRRAGGNRAHWQ